MLKFALIAFGAATMIASAGRAASSTGWTGQQAPGFYRLMVGDIRVTVLSDGTEVSDLPKLMSSPEEVRRELTASHEAFPIELSINCFLIETARKTIIVDTGAGELLGPNSGKLLANLRAAGYRPEDIDVILLTHINSDNSGGLSIGGKPVFPNAMVYVDQHDPAYWLSTAAESHAPENRKVIFTQSHQTIDPYVRAGRLKTFDGAVELFPGIRSVPEHGNSPGLTGYMIESRGQRLLLWGAIIHAAEVQFKDPTVTIDYDVDPEEAAETREHQLNDAAQKGYLVGGTYLSFPGLGHVRAEQNGFSWVPAPYSVILQAAPAGPGSK
jgi:glyoxylase-like metal-dependent hydrolase (beta-lactamase superfamily II)